MLKGDPMKKKILILVTALVVLSAALMVTGHASGLFDFSFSKNQTVTITQAEYDRLQRYSQMDYILQYLEAWYIEEPDVDQLIESATRGMMAGLGDPYTFYYNEAQWAQMLEEDKGVYGGVGIEMLGNGETNTVTITRVFKDGPAQKAGIHKGDLLVRVEDLEVNAYTMQDAVNLMRGTLAEDVEVEVKRGNEYLTFTLTRATITINRVEYTMLEDQVGYIILYAFEGESQKEVANALADLRSRGARSLIIDLRDNPGGYVDAAVSIADLFADDQLLVYSEDRAGTREEYRTKPGADDIPLVFLINGSSASSSEILAGGLHELGRATLVGTKSFGKGIIQAVIPLNANKEAFQMTYAQYFLSSGTKVHKVGIEPDVLAEMPEEMTGVMFELGDMSDPQLQKAWEVAKDMIPKE